MKNMLCIVLLLRTVFLQAQVQEFQSCVDNTFLKWDSLSEVGKDPFELWHDCIVGKKMPSFECKTMNGMKLNSDLLAKKIVVLNVFSVYCEPCVAEVPALNRLAAEYAGLDVELLAVTAEKKEDIKKTFFFKEPARYKVVIDNAAMAGIFGRTGFPAFFIIKEGVIVDAWIGGSKTAGADNPIYELLKTKLDLLRNEK